MPLTLGLSILVSGAFGTVQYTPPAVIPTPQHQNIVPTKTALRALFADAVMSSAPDPYVQTAVKKYFADIPIMISIARCESKFHQYDLSGNILTSVTDDLGVMQINAYTHQATADDMGLDLSNLYDNMAYARYLYNSSGTAPWLSSARCWRGNTGNVAVKPASDQTLAVKVSATADAIEATSSTGSGNI
jgi:hypothetical protein